MKLFKVFHKNLFLPRNNYNLKFFHLTSSVFNDGGVRENVQPVNPAKWNMNWDRRASLHRHEPGKFVNSRYLMFIRAAEPGGSQTEIQGVSDRGKQQAKLTGARLAKLGFPIHYVSHSGASDAEETARIIVKEIKKDLTLFTDPMLRETGGYPPDPPTIRYSDKYYYQNVPFAEAAFRKYFYRPNPDQPPSELELYVTHGNLIRYLLCRALQLSVSGWVRFSSGHGSMTLFIIQSDSKVFLNSFGEVAHIPLNLISGL